MPEHVARDNLCRSAVFTAADHGDGLTLDGYAAVYDTPTRIDSWEGTFDEEVAFGAFARSLNAGVQNVKMQFDHGQHPLLGSLPLGRWTSLKEERGKGLHAVGRLSDNWLVQPFREAIADGSVDGMSFRFSVVRDEWFMPDGSKVTNPDEILSMLDRPSADGPLRRVLREVKISEAGPVVWPAYKETSVGVRSQVTIDLGRLTDPDQQRTLARAVFLADAATRSDGPLVTEAEPDEHSEPERVLTEDQARFFSGKDPQVTDATPDEHPSAEARKRRDRFRAQAQRHAGYMLSIQKEN